MSRCLGWWFGQCNININMVDCFCLSSPSRVIFGGIPWCSTSTRSQAFAPSSAMPALMGWQMIVGDQCWSDTNGYATILNCFTLWVDNAHISVSMPASAGIILRQAESILMSSQTLFYARYVYLSNNVKQLFKGVLPSLSAKISVEVRLATGVETQHYFVCKILISSFVTTQSLYPAWPLVKQLFSSPTWLSHCMLRTSPTWLS